ncbi:Uncharacterized protein TCM_019509 [Theobroma cacao]|uniref:RRM domain-containing protein n=1 Tax=Theobroma cacao TaxID=3641 RepID=A0A061EI02_THECC|nr:Uncharacterized protein TCM_019509 [Theobroma cacao]
MFGKLKQSRIGNLQQEVEWRKLKEIFDEFSVVVDIFLPCPKRNTTTRYAFVRYREERELTKVVFLGHGRMINGRRIRVSKAEKPKNERGIVEAKGSESKPQKEIGQSKKTFKETFIVNSQIEDIGGQGIQTGNKIEMRRIKNVVINKEKLKWLGRNAVGQLRSPINCGSVECSFFKEEGILGFEVGSQWSEEGPYMEWKVTKAASEKSCRRSASRVGDKFTWCGYHDGWVFSRLDHFLVDMEWLDCVQGMIQECLTSSLSDHKPIILRSNKVD